jgi:NAD(P)H-flavin reductase
LLALGRPAKKVALKAGEYIPFALQERTELSHDTRLFRFALQSPKHVLGLPIGQHISLKFIEDGGKVCSRSYTPTTSDDEVSARAPGRALAVVD